MSDHEFSKLHQMLSRYKWFFTYISLMITAVFVLLLLGVE